MQRVRVLICRICNGKNILSAAANAYRGMLRKLDYVFNRLGRRESEQDLLACTRCFQSSGAFRFIFALSQRMLPILGSWQVDSQLISRFHVAGCQMRLRLLQPLEPFLGFVYFH